MRSELIPREGLDRVAVLGADGLRVLSVRMAALHEVSACARFSILCRSERVS